MAAITNNATTGESMFDSKKRGDRKKKKKITRTRTLALLLQLLVSKAEIVMFLLGWYVDSCQC